MMPAANYKSRNGSAALNTTKIAFIRSQRDFHRGFYNSLLGYNVIYHMPLEKKCIMESERKSVKSDKNPCSVFLLFYFYRV